jgi:hypothetical protein
MAKLANWIEYRFSGTAVRYQVPVKQRHFAEAGAVTMT